LWKGFNQKGIEGVIYRQAKDIKKYEIKNLRRKNHGTIFDHNRWKDFV
jgi:hypothetical protein